MTNTFVCPQCRKHRLHISPWQFDGRLCPRCRVPLIGEVRPAPPGFEQFDHTFTPAEARRIIRRIPADSYHWADIETKGAGKVDRFTALMAAGEWRNQTLELGFGDHPIRFDEAGDLTHGVMRLMACDRSGISFRAAVQAPVGMFPSILDRRKRAPAVL